MASEEPAEPPSKAPRAENSSPLPALAQGGGFGSLAAAAPARGSAFGDGGLGAVMQQPPQLFGEESKRTGEGGVNSNAGDESARDGNADEASERPARHEREAEEEGKGCADTKGSCAAPQMSGQAERTGEEDENVLLEAPCTLYEFQPADVTDASETQGDADARGESSEHRRRNPAWKSRGRVTTRLNLRSDSSSARVVMRREGNLRLVLNAALYSGMTLARMQGNNGVMFACLNGAEQSEGEAMKTFALRFTGDGAESNVKLFEERVAELVAKTRGALDEQKSDTTEAQSGRKEKS